MEIIIEDKIKDSVEVDIRINEGNYIFIKNTYIENNGDIDTVIFRELVCNNDEIFSKKRLMYQQED